MINNVISGQTSLAKRTINVELRALIAFFDLLALNISLFIVYSIFTAFDFLGNAENFIDIKFGYYFTSFIIIIAYYSFKGHYKNRVPWWSQVLAITKTMLFMTLLDTLIHGTLDIPWVYCFSLALWATSFVMLIVLRYTSLLIARRSPLWALPIVILGDSQVITDTIYALYADGMTGYEIKTVLLHGPSDDTLDLSFVPSTHPPIQVIDNKDDIYEFIEKNEQFFYVICLHGFRGNRRDELLNTLERSEREYAIIPSTKRLHLYGMEPHYFFGNDIMFLHKRDNFVQTLSLGVKRALDIIATGCVLPFIFILSVIVWIAKRVTGSNTPLFYNGKRIGLNGELFPCWKFCTMRVDADEILENLLESDPAIREEWETYEKLRNDPRVDSAISAWLRKTSLDEIPQLWNVFCGHMSLVGPRPIIPAQKKEYGKDFVLYTSVRPGLTGLWQVSGRNETSFKQRIVWDYWYIRNWSLWHDIVILTKTVRVFLTGSGAY